MYYLSAHTNIRNSFCFILLEFYFILLLSLNVVLVFMTSYGKCITDAEVTRGETKGLSENKHTRAGSEINTKCSILRKQGNNINTTNYTVIINIQCFQVNTNVERQNYINLSLQYQHYVYCLERNGMKEVIKLD